jgi:hypothetical protein
MLVVLVVQPSSTDHIMNRQARITWTVECIRVFLYFYVMFEIQGRVGSRLTFFFDFTDCQVVGTPPRTKSIDVDVPIECERGIEKGKRHPHVDGQSSPRALQCSWYVKSLL